MQYVRKNKTAFHLKLNNHRKDSKKKDAVSACTQFQTSNQKCQRDTKFILIEQITKKYNNIEELKFILKKWESFWVLYLCTLYPDGLNEELNDVSSFAQHLV